jgi:hypothetical protein
LSYSDYDICHIRKTMNVILKRRNYNAESQAIDVDWQVQRYSHAAMGGPKLAEIKVKGDDLELWNFLDRVRCPVEIYSDKGDAVWWGYIAEVQVTAKNPYSSKPNRANMGASIDTMYNRVFVAFTQVDVSGSAVSRQNTIWADGTVSQYEYGIKELLWTKDDASLEHAEAARDKKLNEVQFPIAVPNFAWEASESYATLTCRGWWDTLGWQYYANAGTTTLDTANQAGTIITQEGQFFSAVNQDVTSGIVTGVHRSGDTTALFEATQLLDMGTTNFRRMLASVDINRVVRIYEEPPENSMPHLVAADGSIYSPYGEPLRKEVCPYGMWARWLDIIPPSVDTSLLSGPSKFFIEECEYDPVNDRLRPVMRGELDPWDFPKVKDG